MTQTTPIVSSPVFTFIGGPTLLVEVGTIRFLIDPTFDPPGATFVTGPIVLTKLRGPALSPSDLPQIDAVLLSHDQHGDNLDTAGRACLPLARRVLTTVAGAGRLGANATGMEPWTSQVVLSADGTHAIKVTATPARHGPPGSEPVSGDVIGFCLEWDGAGGAVYLSGDTVWYEGVAEVARRFQVQTAVLFLGAGVIPPVGPEHVTMTADEAVQAVQALNPTFVVPVHYDGWAHFSQGRADVSQAFEAAGLMAKLRWLEPGQPTALALGPPLHVAPV